LVAGNGIQAKSLVHHPVALIDLAPTILEWAGIESETLQMDGQSFAGRLRAQNDDQVEERQILIEYWGEGSVETYSPECPWSKYDKLNVRIDFGDSLLKEID
jgi:N-acetylglucosamine-6-sulfatase